MNCNTRKPNPKRDDQKNMLPNATVYNGRKNIIIDDTINLTRLIMCRRIRSVYARIHVCLLMESHRCKLRSETEKTFDVPKIIASDCLLLRISTAVIFSHCMRADWWIIICRHVCTHSTYYTQFAFVCNSSGMRSPLGKIYETSECENNEVLESVNSRGENHCWKFNSWW